MTLEDVCPKCGKEELGISDNLTYCYCQTIEKKERCWSFTGPTAPKKKSRVKRCGTRMTKIKR